MGVPKYHRSVFLEIILKVLFVILFAMFPLAGGASFGFWVTSSITDKTKTVDLWVPENGTVVSRNEAFGYCFPIPGESEKILGNCTWVTFAHLQDLALPKIQVVPFKSDRASMNVRYIAHSPHGDEDDYYVYEVTDITEASFGRTIKSFQYAEGKLTVEEKADPLGNVLSQTFIVFLGIGSVVLALIFLLIATYTAFKWGWDGVPLPYPRFSRLKDLGMLGIIETLVLTLFVPPTVIALIWFWFIPPSKETLGNGSVVTLIAIPVTYVWSVLVFNQKKFFRKG